MSRIRFVVVVSLLGLAASADAQRKPATRALDQSFDAMVDSVRAAWKVPGIGLAVVKGNQVLLLKGYGYKDLAQQVPATGKTKFAIGSVTKSFAVTALAVQAGEGKLEWDAPVRRYLPDFKMFDDYATEHMTPRDLVIHRSGLPRHDILWGAGGFSREEIYARLRYLEPTRDFRSYWQYQNLMYMTAGYLSGKLAGTSWEEVVKAKVFQPLGMATADVSMTDHQRSADFSFGYARLPTDSVIKLPFKNLDAIGPAGSINASAEDMAKYLIMHLNQGKLEGRQIVPAAQIREMQVPQMVIPAPNQPGPGGIDLGHEQYGMGFFVGTYRGKKMVHHGGNIDGFSAELNFLPNDSIGVVVLTNLNGTNVRDFLPFLVYDRLLGLPPIDWSGRYQAQFTRNRARQDSIRARDVASKVANTKPSHELADFTGLYTHPGYGDIRVGLEGGKLSLGYGSVSVGMEHWHFDVFETGSRSAATPIRWKVQFHMDPTGAVSALSLPIEPALKPAMFARQKATP
jgi:CubicO group peptidase (beta-lactamase class C family)